MDNVATRLSTLSETESDALGAALRAYAMARDHTAQAAYLAGGGHLVATIAGERADAESDSAARNVARVLLDVVGRGRPGTP